MAKMIKKQKGGFDSGTNGTNCSVNLNESKMNDKKNCGCWNFIKKRWTDSRHIILNYKSEKVEDLFLLENNNDICFWKLDEIKILLCSTKNIHYYSF